MKFKFSEKTTLANALRANIFRSMAITLALLPFAVTPAHAAAGDYNTGDIAAINAIIANNGLNWAPANPADGSAVPADWAFDNQEPDPTYTGVIWSEEAANRRVTRLSINGKGLIGSLDVSALTALTSLSCDGNQLTELKVSGLTTLKTLICTSNKLSALDVTGLNLTSFDGGGQKVSLTLTPDGNGSFTAPVTMNANTTFSQSVCISYNAQTGTLTSTDNSAISTNFYSNIVGSENLAGVLTLDYGVQAPGFYNAADIAVINDLIDEHPELGWTKADPADGSYVPPDWTGGIVWTQAQTNKRVYQVNVSNKNLTGTLTVKDLPELAGLYCSGNQLAALNLSELPLLNALDCRNNQLTSLDVSSLTNMYQFNCSNNQLTSLDVSSLTSLYTLECRGNRLTSLDLTGRTGTIPDFYGFDQAPSLTLYADGSHYAAAVNMPGGTTFGDAALSFAGGTLTSTDSAVTSSAFTAPTGQAGAELTGTLTLAYSAGLPVYAIVLDNHDESDLHTFPVATAGYGAQTPLGVTVINTGNQATGNLTVALSGANPDAFELSAAFIGSIAVTGNATFTVKPKIGLSAGTYAATVTVSGGNGISANSYVSFTVNASTLTGVNSPQSKTLSAYVQNGLLHVSGLTAGKPWAIYSVSGALMHQSIAGSDEADVFLPVQGVYIVKADSKTLKVVYLQ